VKKLIGITFFFSFFILLSACQMNERTGTHILDNNSNDSVMTSEPPVTELAQESNPTPESTTSPIPNVEVGSGPVIPNDCGINAWPSPIPPPGILKWSPNGEYIAVQSWLDSNNIIHIYRISDIHDGTRNDELEIFASIQGDSFDWAPDSTNQLVFAREESIYRTALEDEPILLLATRWDRISTITWLSGGNQIAFSPSGTSQLFFINNDGEYVDGYFPQYNYTELAWSPDGELIAYTDFRRDDNSDIKIIRADGGPDFYLTQDPKCDDHPVWSPDGQQIAFTSSRNKDPDPASDPQWDIYVVAVEEGVALQLTTQGYINTQPSWSPDSQKLVYFRHSWGKEESDRALLGDFFGVQDIYIVDVRTGQTVLLTEETWDEAELLPQWSPGGEYIAFFSYDLRNWNDNREWQFQIKIMKADGSGATYLIDNPTSFSTQK
jgi:TolB protein